MEKDLKKAEEYYLKAAELDEDNIMALKNLATIYAETGRTERANQIQEKIRNRSIK
jgi:TPR repeat protein